MLLQLLDRLYYAIREATGDLNCRVYIGRFNDNLYEIRIEWHQLGRTRGYRTVITEQVLKDSDLTFKYTVDDTINKVKYQVGKINYEES